MNQDPAVPSRNNQYLFAIARFILFEKLGAPFVSTAFPVECFVASVTASDASVLFPASREYLGVSSIFLLRYITETAGIAPNPSMNLHDSVTGRKAVEASPTIAPARRPKPCMANTESTNFPLLLTFEYSLIMVALIG